MASGEKEENLINLYFIDVSVTADQENALQKKQVEDLGQFILGSYCFSLFKWDFSAFNKKLKLPKKVNGERL